MVHEEKKTWLREMSTATVTAEDAGDVYEQLMVLARESDIQIRMLTRSCCGNLNTQHPNRFDFDFLNDTHDAKQKADKFFVEKQQKKEHIDHADSAQHLGKPDQNAGSCLIPSNNSQKEVEPASKISCLGRVIYAFILLFCFNIIIGFNSAYNEREKENSVAIELIKNSQIEVAKLARLRLPELKVFFPSIGELDSNSYCKINNWKGWEYVIFHFLENDGRLEGIAFGAQEPLSKKQAKKVVVEIFNCPLDESYLSNAPMTWAYKEMPGSIETVNFHFINLRHDRRVSELLFVFNFK